MQCNTSVFQEDIRTEPYRDDVFIIIIVIIIIIIIIIIIQEDGITSKINYLPKIVVCHTNLRPKEIIFISQKMLMIL